MKSPYIIFSLIYPLESFYAGELEEIWKSLLEKCKKPRFHILC